MADETPDGAENWPPKKRAALVLSILRGEISAQEAAHYHRLSLDTVERWERRFLAAAEDALAAPSADGRVQSSHPKGAHLEDVGVWACTLGPQSIAPCLFMQAACGDSLPAQTSVAWIRADRPPKPFSRTEAVSLLHGECRRFPRAENRLHLFSTKMVETVLFERKSVLSDWQFPVRMVGVVAFVERRNEADPVRWLTRTLRLRVDRTMTWIETQHLPLVVAAMGYGGHRFSEDSIRRHHRLAPQVPIVPGPSPAPRRQPEASLRSMTAGGERGIMSFLLGRRNLCFDPDYAKRILRALSEITGAFGADHT